MDIYKIRKNIKDNKRLAFYAEGRHDILLIESILLNNGYKWRGSNTNGYSLLSTFDKNSPRFNRICIYLNSFDNEFRELSYATKIYTPSITIIVSEFTKDKLNELFINIPTYKPKKIERVI